MKGYKIFFYEKIWKFIPKLSLLPLLIWSSATNYHWLFMHFYYKLAAIFWVGATQPDFFSSRLVFPVCDTLKCLSIGTPKAINFSFVSNEKLMFFRCPSIQAHCNEAVIYLNFGTPKNNEFSIWNKWENLLFLGVPILKHIRVYFCPPPPRHFTISLSSSAMNNLPRAMKICYNQLSDQIFRRKTDFLWLCSNCFKMSQQQGCP